MAQHDCPKCHGKGKVPVMQHPAGYLAPIAETKFEKCEECRGTGERKR